MTTGTRGGHLAVGRVGENLAARHLREDGMRVLQRNWRCRDGELDIVALDGRQVVFCEVKTRRSLRFGTPMRAITDAKARRLRRLARAWWRTARPARCGVRRRRHRFDVVCVVLSPDGRAAAIRHRKGAL